jgi:hypothetical protein
VGARLLACLFVSLCLVPIVRSDLLMVVLSRWQLILTFLARVVSSRAKTCATRVRTELLRDPETTNILSLQQRPTYG